MAGTTKDAIIKVELSQTAFEKQEMATDNNENFYMTDTTVNEFSDFTNKAPTFIVNGIKTGGEITPDSGVNDSVAVASLTLNLNGVEESVSAGTIAVTRAATDTHIINSVIIDNTGAIATVQGTEGTSFSTVRGDAGGPAFIPVDAVEIGQVRLSSATTAEVESTEIEQKEGLSKEMADDIYTVDFLKAEIDFDEALPAIHTGSVAKKVFVEGYRPKYSDFRETNNFVVPEETISTNTTEYYGKVKNNVQRGLESGSFTTTLENGIDDPILLIKGENAHIKWFTSKYSNKHLKGQAIIGINRDFPTSGDITAEVSLNAQQEFIPVTQ